MTTQGDRTASHEADREASLEVDREATQDDRKADREVTGDSLPVRLAAEWLHLAEAARRLKWPMERLRSLARRGKVQTRRGNDGHLFILVTPELVAKAQAEAARPARRSAGDDREASHEATKDDRQIDHEATEDDHEAGRAALMADLQAEVVELQKEVVELRVALAKAEAKIETVETVAQTKADALLSSGEAKEAALRELVEELKAQLVEARKPWWRRIFP